VRAHPASPETAPAGRRHRQPAPRRRTPLNRRPLPRAAALGWPSCA
jgi:hypothetical protein